MAGCTSHGKKWVKRVDILVVVLLIFGACAGCIHQEEGSEPAPAMEDYFRGDFITTGEPILNQEVEILFSITPVLEAPNTSITVYLPEGIELVHGDIHWEGDIQKDEVVQITFTVKPVQEGQLILWSYVESVFSSKHKEHYTYYLVFLTSKDSGQVSRTHFYSEHQDGKILEEMTVNMILDPPPDPKANEEMILTFSLIASKDISNVRAVVVLPEEFVLVNGTLEWTGALEEAKKIVAIQVTVIPTETGRFWFVGTVTYDDEWRYKFQIYVN
jgi:hypothetical protein